MTPKNASLPLTELRRRLSPVVGDIDGLGAVAVTVRGEVRAYLVSPARYERAQAPVLPRPIRGSLRLEGDLDEGSRDAAARWLAAARR
jgi:PHD/YefM family antitoxin component YafN of YafNO toxin-antitoxin module